LLAEDDRLVVVLVAAEQVVEDPFDRALVRHDDLDLVAALLELGVVADRAEAEALDLVVAVDTNVHPGRVRGRVRDPERGLVLVTRLVAACLVVVLCRDDRAADDARDTDRSRALHDTTSGDVRLYHTARTRGWSAFVKGQPVE